LEAGPGRSVGAVGPSENLASTLAPVEEASVTS
jgi:hypothetical protein